MSSRSPSLPDSSVVKRRLSNAVWKYAPFFSLPFSANFKMCVKAQGACARELASGKKTLPNTFAASSLRRPRPSASAFFELEPCAPPGGAAGRSECDQLLRIVVSERRPRRRRPARGKARPRVSEQHARTRPQVRSGTAHGEANTMIGPIESKYPTVARRPCARSGGQLQRGQFMASI